MYSRNSTPIEFCSQECLNSNTFNIAFKITPPPVEYISIDFKIDIEYEKKCECGAEKCKTTHSDWCPKYK